MEITKEMMSGLSKQIISGDLSLHSESDSFFLIRKSNDKRLPLTSKQYNQLIKKTSSIMRDDNEVKKRAQKLAESIKKQLNEFEAQEDVTVREICLNQKNNELGILFSKK